MCDGVASYMPSRAIVHITSLLTPPSFDTGVQGHAAGILPPGLSPAWPDLRRCACHQPQRQPPPGPGGPLPPTAISTTSLQGWPRSLSSKSTFLILCSGYTGTSQGSTQKDVSCSTETPATHRRVGRGHGALVSNEKGILTLSLPFFPPQQIQDINRTEKRLK